jgi:chemotaxis signal transduction protein
MVVGLMVDTISDVIDAPAEKIEAAPRRKNASARDSIVTGLIQVDGEVRILIDLERLLHDEPAAPDGMADEDFQKT